MDTPNGNQAIALSKTQWGKPYRFGFEVPHRAGPNLAWFYDAKAWDCSEFTEGVHAALGVYLPDGSSAQADYVDRISIASAKRIPGALLGHGPTRGRPGHVVFSLGDGAHTSEAMGRAYGVRMGNIDGRGFTWAGTVRGMHYDTGIYTPPAGPPPAGSPAALMQAVFFAKQFRLGNHQPGVLNEFSPGAVDAIKFAQAGLNHWFGNFARLTNQPDPDDHAIDGVWEGWTHDATILFQQITKTPELGTTGPLTWNALYP